MSIKFTQNIFSPTQLRGLELIRPSTIPRNCISERQNNKNQKVSKKKSKKFKIHLYHIRIRGRRIGLKHTNKVWLVLILSHSPKKLISGSKFVNILSTRGTTTFRDGANIIRDVGGKLELRSRILVTRSGRKFKQLLALVFLRTCFTR